MRASGALAAQTYRRIFRLVFLALAFLLAVADGVAAIVVWTQLRVTDARVDRASQAAFALQDIEDGVVRISQDQLAYRMSGDVDWLQGYRREAAKLPGELARLHDLVAGSDSQSSQLADLTRLIDQDHVELEATLTPIQPHFDSGRLPAELAANIARTNAIFAAADEM